MAKREKSSRKEKKEEKREAGKIEEKSAENTEKQKEKKEEKSSGQEKPKSYAKQTKIVVIIMFVLLASVFVAYWLVQESKTFEYHNMKFYKEKEGALMFYKSLLGYATKSGESIPFIIKLRGDPRQLDKIPIEGEIKNLKEKVVFSVSPEIANCSDTPRVMVDFSMTLGAFGLKTSAATSSKEYAKQINIPLIDCKDAKDKTVILMKEGNETKIVKTGECYTLEISECRVQDNFERFTLALIENSIVKTRL